MALGPGLLFFFALMLAWLATPLAAQAEEEFLDPEQAFVLTAAMSQPHQLDIHFQIAPEYYMYRKRFAVSTEKAEQVGKLQLPEGERVYDPTFDEVMEVYRHSVTLRVPVLADSSIGHDLTVDVVSQGCADAGLCYSPSTQTLTLIPTGQGWEVAGPFGVVSVPAPGEGASQNPAQANPDSTVAPSRSAGVASALSLSDVGLADYLKQAGWGQIVLLSFVFGLLLSFTPCVLPMVPILLSIIAGRNQPAPSRWHGLKMAFAFVLGLSLVYTLLGEAAGLLGAGLASWLQNPWVLGLFALILVVLALSMLDVFTVQAPAALQNRLNKTMNRLPGGQMGGVFLMGMLSALIVGPCVAAPLAGVLLFISQTGDVGLGFRRLAADCGCGFGQCLAQGRRLDGKRQDRFWCLVAGYRLVDGLAPDVWHDGCLWLGCPGFVGGCLAGRVWARHGCTYAVVGLATGCGHDAGGLGHHDDDQHCPGSPQRDSPFGRAEILGYGDGSPKPG
jgi:thiol:disulfide interchange protein DsbD